jgi:GDP-mannose 6-dehydrogenase
MHVTVLGLGYVGCVTAACLARDGHEVVGVDVSADKVATINAGLSPIIEPGLAELTASVVREGRLSATESVEDAIEATDVVLISVGTPDLGHGQQDLEALARVATSLGRASVGRTRPLTVVLRSTVLPGTTERVLAPLLGTHAAAADSPLRLAVNPEFMREGSSIEDFDRPPFILVGSDDPDTTNVVRALYDKVDAPFLATSIRTAEMVKYACNAFHALKICFANEIADLCEALGASGQEVMELVRQDRKLNASPAYLRPGFAFGGSCLPKDLRALISAGRIHDVPVPLLGAIVSSNDGQIRRGVDAVLQTGKRRIGVVGLAFKPKTDDLRESPMVALVESLIGKGCDVRIYDPTIVMARLRGANRRYIENGIPHIASLLCDNSETLVAHAEVLVFGSTGADAARVLAAADSRHTIVDLTHDALGIRNAKTDARPGASQPSEAEPAGAARAHAVHELIQALQSED